MTDATSGELVTVAQAAKQAGRYDAVVYGWIKAGLLKKARGKVNLAEVLKLSKDRPQRRLTKKTKAKVARVAKPRHSAKQLFGKADTDVSKVVALLKVLKPDGFRPKDYESMLTTVQSLTTLVETDAAQV